MSLSEALPAQEKYRIAANHYRIVNDNAKAVEAYENLVKASPNSPGAVRSGQPLRADREFDKARDASRSRRARPEVRRRPAGARPHRDPTRESQVLSSP